MILYYGKLNVCLLDAQGKNSFKGHFPRPEDFAKAIYTFDIGQNDIAAAINKVDTEDSHAVISDIVDYFENQVQVSDMESLNVYFCNLTWLVPINNLRTFMQ